MNIVTVGMGQLGAQLSLGLLKCGHSVTPVLRGDDLSATCAAAEPDVVLVATGEDDLDSVLEKLPTRLRDHVILIQNELRPNQWQKHGVSPTVAIIWFEKKKGKLPVVVLPTVLYGQHAPLLQQALDAIELPYRTIDSDDELAHQLVLKNLYILGLNLSGLRAPGVAADLLGPHRELFDTVVNELLAFEGVLLLEAPPFGVAALDELRLRTDLEAAIMADPSHGCAGRSAPRRLERTLELAAQFGAKVPYLTSLSEHS